MKINEVHRILDKNEDGQIHTQKKKKERIEIIFFQFGFTE